MFYEQILELAEIELEKEGEFDDPDTASRYAEQNADNLVYGYAKQHNLEVKEGDY